MRAGFLLIKSTTKIAKQHVSHKKTYVLESINYDLSLLKKLVHKYKVEGKMSIEKVLAYEEKVHRIQMMVQRKLS